MIFRGLPVRKRSNADSSVGCGTLISPDRPDYNLNYEILEMSSSKVAVAVKAALWAMQRLRAGGLPPGLPDCPGWNFIACSEELTISRVGGRKVIGSKGGHRLGLAIADWFTLSCRVIAMRTGSTHVEAEYTVMLRSKWRRGGSSHSSRKGTGGTSVGPPH
jgi:hypothetical protein